MSRSEAPAVQLRDVSFAYQQGQSVLERITLTVPRGVRLGVLGPNGGGKSTLLKIVLALLTPSSGHVEVLGRPARQAIRQRLVGYLPQRLDVEWRAPVSVRQVVSMTASLSLSPWQMSTLDIKQRVERMIDLVGMSEHEDKPIGQLSGGQQQRVFIARALASEPQLLLLDEPTVGIDQKGQEQFAKLLRTIHEELRITILIVSHDLRAIAAGCDEIAVLSRTLHYHAAPEGLTPEVLAEVFHHDIAAFAHAQHGGCSDEHEGHQH